ncbi:GNAT family acetyltransferase [[Clostridium] sordellii]|uniref:GNAT family acetyltransferase n=1 Tax=Paraclostridium sordellii TaxID=1505 RepID=A0A9P1L1U0_PARSO|nr:GNAT family N-acetyltransferase [Paeniclostridium sordellii]CEO33598.1 GNAT family acetyltransferase [[Clostridium] sordellii] [Paeniclostridium sordellii]CEQ10073.1 GNAT family acetyltransferase [[Clostridium] sordellii] [Paeniclostridium sordellii]
MGKIFLETDRLILRQISENDFNDIANILQDIEIMYAWEKSFSDDEVLEWINKNIDRYKRDGYSYFLAINKINKEVVGVMGPLIENINGKEFIGVAYILNKESWGRGYATEGIKECIRYVFENTVAEKVIAQIRPENKSSIKVALRLGMELEGEFTKLYEGKHMKHLIYSIKK